MWGEIALWILDRKDYDMKQRQELNSLFLLSSFIVSDSQGFHLLRNHRHWLSRYPQIMTPLGFNITGYTSFLSFKIRFHKGNIFIDLPMKGNPVVLSSSRKNDLGKEKALYNCDPFSSFLNLFTFK